MFRIGTWLFILLILPLTGVAGPGNGWYLAKNKDGIKVYTRFIPGERFKEYKAETVVKATPEQVLRILERVRDYPVWMNDIKYARLLRWENDSVFYTWSQVALPWPFHDRDQVSRSVIEKEKSGVIRVKIFLTPQGGPHPSGVVRIQKGHGYWLLLPEPGAKTKVVFQFLADLGTSLPAWLVNMFIVNSPFQTLEGLKKELKKSEENR